MENFNVNILGQKWKIKYKPRLINPERGEVVCGYCDPASLTIWINSELDNQLIVITLIHELFHAYTRRSGIYNAQLSEDLEEIISDQFAIVIAENFDFEL